MGNKIQNDFNAITLKLLLEIRADQLALQTDFFSGREKEKVLFDKHRKLIFQELKEGLYAKYSEMAAELLDLINPKGK